LLINSIEKFINFSQRWKLALTDKHFTIYLGNNTTSTLTVESIYQQSLDKQRIVIVGEGSGLIASLVIHTLTFFNRKFDYVLPDKPPAFETDAPIILIHATDQLLDYKHHIAVLTNLGSGDSASAFEQLAEATPKGGTLLYPELTETLKKIGIKERTDVQSIGYSRYKHELKEGKTLLISSKGERFPVAVSGDKNLEYISAAKELLKKIGITSGQFYKAISTYLPA
jgi:UDP-N-acetylmuramate: L-alanyl-gamma-D-glutamyl-meso-diaminopimelate ligase